ncbi:TetR/AcrR family transcriptional regulator [Methylocystis parvus]|uniref:TetR/AcrR family transcriptional regulator n=1 Tax=Methylocystis parvus TaxID=134 RepID=A0A6B8M685_9HYPH|nr:TetR/AcrR family transcriptional regulator [Methylocystis parvus]QGM97978.1 TetR/AcrR family transcriptional regulator [Methylocystis parvus]WBK01708.1 TetR family transcriptional regulator [Methylocystis parvus OBBP]
MSVVAEAASAREAEQRCRIVATAERLFREIGFQKTTVADIARALRMSPANVYRFFGSKSEIHVAVARQLMGEVEAAAQRIAAGPGTASERLRALVRCNEAMNADRYLADRKMHEMVEAALDEHWPMIDEHIDRVDAVVQFLVASGMESGEFAKGDPELAAKLVHTALIRFCHPRLMVECADRPEPTSEQMIDFCLAALRAGVSR